MTASLTVKLLLAFHFIIFTIFSEPQYPHSNCISLKIYVRPEQHLKFVVPQAIRRRKAKKGVIVAFSFGKGAYDEIVRAKLYDGIKIETLTIRDLIGNKNKTTRKKL